MRRGGAILLRFWSTSGGRIKMIHSKYIQSQQTRRLKSSALCKMSWFQSCWRFIWTGDWLIFIIKVNIIINNSSVLLGVTLVPEIILIIYKKNAQLSVIVSTVRKKKTRWAEEEVVFLITTAECDKIHAKRNNVMLKVPQVWLTSGSETELCHLSWSALHSTWGFPWKFIDPWCKKKKKKKKHY